MAIPAQEAATFTEKNDAHIKNVVNEEIRTEENDH